jgi:hypothetical protein
LGWEAIDARGMITDVWNFWINTVSFGPPFTIPLTVPFNPEFGLPQPNITATIAISASSQGFNQDSNTAGAVGANITQYQHVNAQGSIETVDVPADFIFNAIDIDQCYSVTFALTAQLAWAYALVTIYFRN